MARWEAVEYVHGPEGRRKLNAISTPTFEESLFFAEDLIKRRIAAGWEEAPDDGTGAVMLSNARGEVREVVMEEKEN